MGEVISPKPGNKRSPVRSRGVTFLILSCLGATALAAWWVRPKWLRPVHRSTELVSTYTNTRAGIAYVGDAVCAKCHAAIARTYRQHPMGRSLAPFSPAEEVGPLQTSFDAGGFRYGVQLRDGRLVHTETRADAEGNVVTEASREIAYVLGSGTRGRSYLIDQDGVLTQSPISWFTQAGHHDLAPGYSAANTHFERPIVPDCLFCHANRVVPERNTISRYERPIFRGHAIGCERCHGPGELHAAHPQTGRAGQDTSIVNPANLDLALRDAVCEQCHLQGDARVEPAARGLANFRPGLPLYRFVSVFFDADKLEWTRAVGQVEQMHASQCYQQSRGVLGCTSCHDPHERPSPAARIDFYRDRCLACHESKKACSLALDARRQESPRDDCVQCHMPRMPSTDILHNAATDHRVPLRPGKARRMAAPASIEAPQVRLFHTGQLRTSEERAEADRALGLALAQKLTRTSEPQQRAGLARRALPLLTAALDASEEDVQAARAKAFVLEQGGRTDEAFELLKSALVRLPRHEGMLADATADALQLQRHREALAYARRLVQVNPHAANHQGLLAEAYALARDWHAAAAAARSAIRLDPSSKSAWTVLIESRLQAGQAVEARRDLEKLLVLDPGQREELERWFNQAR
jgi:predicted CXXCH cytochrome family protein